MRSCCRSVCFLLLMDSKIPPRVGRAWRPIRRVVHFGAWCVNRPVFQPLGWSAQAKVVNFWGLALRVVNVPGSGPERIDSMAAFRPEKTKILQSLGSDADAEMSSSSASEGDTLEYDMSKDLEDTPQNICPTTLPPPSTARKR
ncbi:hypothetical protein AVEN_197935-1 [Araneus ventricosus]|uniref:Uncharacterized protein n=1 Tax=Araneus ventricosus TaxID=182803 RepID=A0A4Y2CLD0_ARAVE|nr:hypothetical protein AVEN_197935-1 [Araneus ventricosus]